MKALTVFVRSAAGAALLMLCPLVAAGQATAVDPLARARQLYNTGDYDRAVAAAREATTRPGAQNDARLLLGRALLERHRVSRTPEDLAAARVALLAVDPEALADRGRLDLMVGLGEALYLDGQYRSAAALIEPALDQMGLLAPEGREQVVDWWATAMDRYAQTRPPEARGEVYDEITTRMRQHLGRYPDSSAASYWLPAAALARGDLDVAWDLALAGWVRSTLALDRGVPLRADLDRLVTQALIPERVKRLSDEREATDTATRLSAEWEEMKGRWKK